MFSFRTVIFATVALTAAAPPAGVHPQSADNPVAQLVAQLPVAADHIGGYQRTLFPHWTDDDSDGCNTRCEVLAAEKRTDLPGLPAGGWFSAYDNATTTNARSFDVDHLVPLAEAWRSGAANWTRAQRQAYANDLGEPAALQAVTAGSNRTKSDQDPARWMPPVQGHWCRYVADWTIVKLRWKLTVDPAEQQALQRIAATCDGVTLAATSDQTPLPADLTPGTPAATNGNTSVSGGTSSNGSSNGSSGDGAFWASCRDARAAGAAPLYRGQPGYRPRLDRDGDGVACE